MTRRQFNQLINELDGKSPFIVLHRDAVAPKYVGVEVSKFSLSDVKVTSWVLKTSSIR